MTERVIWERTIDHERIQRRNARFKLQFFIPAAVALVATFVLGGWGNALGVLLLLVIIGLLWGTTVRYKSLSDAANPVMTVDAGRLQLGDRTVLLADVKRFTTIATSVQTSVLGKYSRLHVGKAIFRVDVPGTSKTPELIEFGWPSMREPGLESVRAALQAELPGKWVEPTELVERDELPERPRLLRKNTTPDTNDR